MLITIINRKKAKRGKQHPFYGKTHSKEARAKLSAAREGKTYEEILGVDEAKQLREAKQLLTGNKNPNYYDIDARLLKLLQYNPTITRQAISNMLGCSGPTLTKRFKTLLGIDNIQQFRYNKSTEELTEFFTGKLNDHLHNTT